MWILGLKGLMQLSLMVGGRDFACPFDFFERNVMFAT